MQQPDLAGKLIAETGNLVFLVDLQTGERRDIGTGNWPDLSSDGRLAAYSGTTDGLHVVDLATGEDNVVSGTTVSDYNPRWSPDGEWLAFRRSVDGSLYRVRPGGPQLQRLTLLPGSNLLLDWTSDASGLYFGVPAGPTSLRLRLFDLEAGTAFDLFTIHARDASAAMSPDGQRIAYIARVPGQIGYGLYVARLDGSAPRLLVQLDYWGVIHPQWSPDGARLLVGAVNTDLIHAPVMPAVVDPETCEAVPLAGIRGYVHDWSP